MVRLHIQRDVCITSRLAAQEAARTLQNFFKPRTVPHLISFSETRTRGGTTLECQYRIHLWLGVTCDTHLCLAGVG